MTQLKPSDISTMLANDMLNVVGALGLDGRKQGKDFVCRNPNRSDKTIGSFRVCISGVKSGRWADFALDVRGDALGLVAYILNGNTKVDRDVINWAKDFLNLGDNPDPEHTRRIAEKNAENRRKQEQFEQGIAKKKRKQANAIYLNAERMQLDSPVGYYLANRSIEFPIDGHLPTVLRDAELKHPNGNTYHAMVAPFFNSDGNIMAVHRTFIFNDGYGYKKIPVDVGNAKMVLGKAMGCFIPVWRGVENGKLLPPLSKSAPGQTLYLCEGIEDALSVAYIEPSLRVWAVYSVYNFQNIKLPPSVSKVVIVADNDDGEQAVKAIDIAVQKLSEQGVDVFIARSRDGKDFNDWLQKNERK